MFRLPNCNWCVLYIKLLQPEGNQLTTTEGRISTYAPRTQRTQASDRNASEPETPWNDLPATQPGPVISTCLRHSAGRDSTRKARVCYMDQRVTRTVCAGVTSTYEPIRPSVFLYMYAKFPGNYLKLMLGFGRTFLSYNPETSTCKSTD